MAEKVSLYDPERNTIMELYLSPEDAIRAHQDMEFATSLMNAVLKEQKLCQPTADNASKSSTVASEGDGTCQVSVTEENIIEEEENISNLHPNDPDVGESHYRWSTSCVNLLLQTYKEKENKFTNGKQSQKKTWEEVSQILKSNGHNVTGAMCAAKLRSLKKTFKAVKDHNNTSGNDRRTWQFFEIMDEIFSKKAWCVPVAIASSSGLSKKCAEESSMGSDSDCVFEPSTSKRRCTTQLMEKLRQKEKCEEAKAKRHEERMEMDNKFLAVLEKLAKK